MGGPRYFIVAGLGRSGSTLLTKLLNSHPDIQCLGEEISPFGINTQFPEMPYSELITTKMFDGARAHRGFKLPWDWILKYPDVLAHIKAINASVIFLTRENRLQQSLSVLLAQTNNNWGSTQPYEVQQVAMDENWLIDTILSLEYGNLINKTMFESLSLPMIEVEFNQLFDRECQARMLTFIGADVRELTTTSVKGRSIPLSSAITNYGELKKNLAGTRFAKYFVE
ncbi:sulfotransferase [Methylocystis sp. WRRC1]|uniref:sulfotransferase family protein n=1 Tax=Methylocystis sp. WRRC1 TaxID=1732014 RepID=UPI001D134594|nr:sulfotransferase [Methylocystis sp. WRRC1]MCC3247421.1 sulfotransferase [Methylocystis sp. WRRC1]